MGGGRVGDYDVIVTRTNYGKSSVAADANNDFSYKIVVTGVTPNTGSIGGGTPITITGLNFKEGDTQVFIGDGKNMLCEITSVTAT